MELSSGSSSLIGGRIFLLIGGRETFLIFGKCLAPRILRSRFVGRLKQRQACAGGVSAASMQMAAKKEQNTGFMGALYGFDNDKHANSKVIIIIPPQVS